MLARSLPVSRWPVPVASWPMTPGEVTFAVISAALSVAAIGLGLVSRRDARRSADAADRSAAEAKRSNELVIEAAERQRFVWSIDAFPEPHGPVTYVQRNDGTDTAEDVVLIPGAVEPGTVIPEFRYLPNGATIHRHGSHEFYTDRAMAEVPPREMLLSWRGHPTPRPIALPSV
jgi:hypothetical protein